MLLFPNQDGLELSKPTMCFVGVKPCCSCQLAFPFFFTVVSRFLKPIDIKFSKVLDN